MEHKGWGRAPHPYLQRHHASWWPVIYAIALLIGAALLVAASIYRVAT